MGMCKICGTKLLSTGACPNLNCVKDYDFEDTLSGFLNSNLWIADRAVGQLCIDAKPIFYLLGGAALCLHDLKIEQTHDIDTANRIEGKVKEAVEGLFDDMASEVVIIPRNYRDRAVRIREDLLSIEVYLVSKEDLFLSKALTGRYKDERAIKRSGILEDINKDLLLNLVYNELSELEREQALKVIDYYFGEAC